MDLVVTSQHLSNHMANFWSTIYDLYKLWYTTYNIIIHLLKYLGSNSEHVLYYSINQHLALVVWLCAAFLHVFVWIDPAAQVAAVEDAGADSIICTVVLIWMHHHRCHLWQLAQVFHQLSRPGHRSLKPSVRATVAFWFQRKPSRVWCQSWHVTPCNGDGETGRIH